MLKLKLNCTIMRQFFTCFCLNNFILQIKVVRETMNQTLELWKDIPDASGDVSTGNFFCHSISLIINLINGD